MRDLFVPSKIIFSLKDRDNKRNNNVPETRKIREEIL